MRDSRSYGIEHATKVGGISHRQALTWAKNGILVPSRVYVTDYRPYTLLYSFDDLVALRVISILREQYGLSLQAARAASDAIRATPKTDWNDQPLWVLDKRVHISDPLDTSAIRLDLAAISAGVRKDADKFWQRDPVNYGKIEYRRDVYGGTLVVKGTRISVATVANLIAAGWDADRIRRSYPTLQPEDIRGVMHYVEEQRNVA
jgi:uncharacterized protein (DUF433 family)/DNA-binding transcriptional MerR regulator